MNILFIVTSPDNKVLYYAPSILELFRLRKVYNPPADAKLYRHISTIRSTDAYFVWCKVTLWWLPADKHTGTGFGLTSFESLELNYRMLGGK